MIPIEVKSSNDYTTVSLDRFAKAYPGYCAERIVLHPGDADYTKDITYLPLYMTPLVARHGDALRRAPCRDERGRGRPRHRLGDCSDLVLNLNPPPAPSLDFSWVRPGAASWDWWVESNNSLSTDLTLRLVDFAAEMGWPYHTIDGGWYGWARRPNHGPDVPVEIRRGFDLHRIIAHARRTTRPTSPSRRGASRARRPSRSRSHRRAASSSCSGRLRTLRLCVSFLSRD